MRNSILVGLAIGALLAPSYSAPKIKVDAAEFDVGVIMEGTKEKVRHEFLLTNIGKDVLRIVDVRAG